MKTKTVERFTSASGDVFEVRTTASEGTTWYKNGKLHRDGDEPARIFLDGSQMWFKEGVLHREGDKPAAVEFWGEKKTPVVLRWYKHGVLHREHGPAWLKPNGREEWWLHGERHRTGGPALITEDGTLMWWENGLMHREGGPAVIDPRGVQLWYWRGKLHNFTGPATVFNRENWVSQWWVHGVESNFISECETAANLSTDSQTLFHLCEHEDFVVRAIAAANPQCPEGGKILQGLWG